jgi:hypothetical protein
MKISQSYLNCQFDSITKAPLIVSIDHIDPKISIVEFKNQYKTKTIKFAFQIEKTYRNVQKHI